MITFSKRLKQFIESYPTRRLFAEAMQVDESVVSTWMAGKREVTKDQMERLHRLTGWALGDLFDIVDEKEGHA